MSENAAVTYLSDRLNTVEQRNKRLLKSLEYLTDVAKQELQKEDNTIETEILAMEIIKVYKDTTSYTFDL